MNAPKYVVTCSTLHHSGTRVCADTAEYLGDAFQAEYDSRAAAQEEADYLAEELVDYDADAAWSVETV